jgi:hypothetical protein
MLSVGKAPLAVDSPVLFFRPQDPQARKGLGPGIAGNTINAVDQGAMEAGLNGSPLRIGEHGGLGTFSGLGIPTLDTAERFAFLDPAHLHRPPPVAPRLSPLRTDVTDIGFDPANGAVMSGTGKAAVSFLSLIFPYQAKRNCPTCRHERKSARWR